jgi:hypothetical protein
MIDEMQVQVSEPRSAASAASPQAASSQPDLESVERMLRTAAERRARLHAD